MEPTNESKPNTIKSKSACPSLAITVLLNEVNKMMKSPMLDADLSQVLDSFLVKLDECEQYLANGIFTMNFAEAALLLQSSADMYGKKVDLLWDITFECQKRILSEENDENKEVEIEKLEERKRKYKRKRKANADENQSKKLVNSFSFGTTDNINYLNQEYCPSNLMLQWKKFKNDKESPGRSRLDCGNNFVFIPDTNIYTEDEDYLGRYEQFHSVTLIEEIFNLERHNLLHDEQGCITKMRIDSYVINNFLRERGIPVDKSQEFYINELNEYITNFIESNKKQIKNYNIQPEAAYSQINDKEISYKKSFINVERLSTEIVKGKLRRPSTTDSLFGDNDDRDNLNSISESCQNINDDNNNKDGCHSQFLNEFGQNLEKRNKSCSQDSAFYELEDDVDGDCTPATYILETPKRNTSLQSVLSTPVAIATSTPKSTIVEKSLCCRSRNIPLRVTRMRNCKVIDFKELKKKVKLPVKKRRISENLLLKLSTGITANLREFEKFFRTQYLPADGEGQVPNGFADLNSESEAESEGENEDLEHTTEETVVDDDSATVNDDVDDDNDEGNDENEQISPPVNSLPFDTLKENTFDQCRFTFENYDPEISERTVACRDDEIDEELRRNISEWRSFIIPKLKMLGNKSDFDIHEYGSKIMDPVEVGEKRGFKDIVAGKNGAEVSRYFIATLQLASTSNIKISGAVPGQISNDSFELTVTDKTKYHELLEEYQAPSEETFLERLKRVKAQKQNVARHFTPVMEPPTKKPKLIKSSRKIQF